MQVVPLDASSKVMYKCIRKYGTEIVVYIVEFAKNDEIKFFCGRLNRIWMFEKRAVQAPISIITIAAKCHLYEIS